MSSLMPRNGRDDPQKKTPAWDTPNPDVDELPEIDRNDTDDDPYSEIEYRRTPPPPKPGEQPPIYMDGWVIS